MDVLALMFLYLYYRGMFIHIDNYLYFMKWLQLTKSYVSCTKNHLITRKIYNHIEYYD